MERRTKIISTVGPKTNTESFISKLCVAGTNVIRINMSHASHAELEKVITIVKRINKFVKIFMVLSIKINYNLNNIH